MTTSERPTSDATELVVGSPADFFVMLRDFAAPLDGDIPRLSLSRLARKLSEKYRPMLASAPASPAIGVQAVTDEMVERLRTTLVEVGGIHIALSLVRQALEAALHPAPEAASAGGVGETTKLHDLIHRHPATPGTDEEAKELLTKLGPIEHASYGEFIPMARAIVHEYLEEWQAVRDETRITDLWTCVEDALRQRIACAMAFAAALTPSDTAPSPKGVSDGVREALRKAAQLADRATDWNLYEVEIDGEMVSVYDLAAEFHAVSQEPVPVKAEERAASKEGA